MKLFPPTITDQIERAREELATNDTITVYDFEFGEEFNRRPANPFLGIRRSFERLSASATKMTERMQDM
jgi:hypothetical protein